MLAYISFSFHFYLSPPPSLSLAFPSACDSQGASATSSPSPPSLPCCHADAARLEEEYVHQVYNTIASHFSSTRHSPWPRVCHFLSSLPPGSMLADVGCGNGKYLGVNPEVIAVSVATTLQSCVITAQRGRDNKQWIFIEVYSSSHVERQGLDTFSRTSFRPVFVNIS